LARTFYASLCSGNPKESAQKCFGLRHSCPFTSRTMTGYIVTSVTVVCHKTTGKSV
jgi:hypothetical protein